LYDRFSQRREGQFVRQSDLDRVTNYRRNNGSHYRNLAVTSVTGPNIYIMYIPKRQPIIGHSLPSKLTDFPMYRLAEVEITAVYPRIRKQSNVIGGREDQDVLCDALCVNKNAFPDFVLVNSGARTRSWRSLGSLGKRFARCLYIALLTSLKNRNWPDVGGSALAAAASSS
ncbi:hypothetical protein T4A_10706, partial [Trichinella pseudospiralis]